MTDIITKDEVREILDKHYCEWSFIRPEMPPTNKFKNTNIAVADKVISKINEKIGHRWIDCDDFKAILLDTSFEFGVLKKISNDKYMLEIEYPKNKF